MEKNIILNFLRKDSKKLKTDIAAVFITGILLIIVGNGFLGMNKNLPAKTVVSDKTESGGQDNEYENLEARMSSIFSKVEGAGEVEVMITLKSGSEIVVAQEEKLSERTDTNGEEKNSEIKATLLDSTGGTNAPLILKENSPEIEGVVIIAQGGDDVIVKESLTKGAQALLNVPAHKVEVFKMVKK